MAALAILRNHGTPGRHWVSFELAGGKSNRLALNARLKIVAGGVTQTDEIHSGGSYLSQNDLRVHFGVGAVTKIDSLEIHWPSGKVETLIAPKQPISSTRCSKGRELFRRSGFVRPRRSDKGPSCCSFTN